MSMKPYLHASFAAETGEAIVYDLTRGEVVHAITDYTICLHDTLHRNSLTIRNSALRLVRFWHFLNSRGKGLLDIDDRLVAVYRDHELTAVTKDRSHRGSLRAARATVNQKVGTILGWMVWLQSVNRLPAGSIGPSKCSVTASSTRRRSPRSMEPGDIVSSPLFLRDAGNSGARPSVRAPVFDSAVRTIMETVLDPYIAERNVLFLDVARTAGFRRGSIASLRADQFEPSMLQQWCEPTFEVRPPVQKRGYENTFHVPLELALRISDFVEGARRQLMESLGIDERTAQRRIFLSRRTGAPVTERAMTQALRPAMRAAGAPRGKVIHAMRGLFAQETINLEAVSRRDAGLDTRTESIAMATAWKLGQKNAESLFPYVADELSRIAQTERAKKRRS